MKPKLVCSENNVQLAKDLTSKNPECSSEITRKLR